MGGDSLDSTERTKQLQKQLILEGSLFSRNTVGGALGNGTVGFDFMCPGGQKCLGTGDLSSFDEAVKYDLNYLRRGFDGWDLNGNTVLDSNEYQNVGFVVKYNPDNQVNPLIGLEER